MFWYLNRLRSMSLPEIIFRLKQLLQKQFEKYFEQGQAPKMPKVAVKDTSANVADIKGFRISGQIKIFGKDFKYLNGEIDWSTDIFSGNKFPLVFSKSINIRCQKNLSAKNVWEINRLQFLTLIAINYKVNNNKKELARFSEIISSWVKQNPYMVGVNWYSNIEVNIRLIVWYFCWIILDVNELRKKNPEFEEFVEQEWLPAIFYHCVYSFKNPSRYSSSNNHLVAEYAGLFIASSLWQFPQSEKWHVYSKKGLEREIGRQHSKNGINKEQAAEYIQFVTDFFLLSYLVARQIKNPFSKKFEEQLKQIFYYIDNLLDEKGNFPKYGDEDDGSCLIFSEDSGFNNFLSLLTSGKILFKDLDLNHLSPAIDIKNRLLFKDVEIAKINFEGEKGVRQNSKFYPEEGHFIFRHKFKEQEVYLHFNAAPLGFLSIAAHGHADALSFSLHYGGQPFFVDPGTYTYHSDFEWRKYFIGTLAHNTVRINKNDQATIAGPTLWLNHYETKILNTAISNKTEFAEALHTGYQKMGIIHTRLIELDKREHLVRINDNFECRKKGSFFLEIPFHMHPDISIKKEREVIKLMGSKNAFVFLKTDNSLANKIVKGQEKPQILGWYSKSFTQKEPSITIYCTATITNSQTFQTLILFK